MHQTHESRRTSRHRHSPLVAHSATRRTSAESARHVGRAEKSLETQGRILDAAEELFAARGVDGVTLRDMASLAEVDTALLHYYFDDKNGILDAVLARRGVILHHEVIEALSQYEREAGNNVTPQGTLAAYLRPFFSLGRKGGKAWQNYCALFLQLGSSSEWGTEAVVNYFDPVSRRMMEVMRKALPGATEADLCWCHLMLARTVTLSFAKDDRIKRLSGGACRAGDLDALEPRMVEFLSAGFRAVCSRKARKN
jgi:AcrR family transcriptional regulator